MVNSLPIYKINGQFYFLDKRLNEYRNIRNPQDIKGFDDVDLSELQTATEKEKADIFG